MARVDGGEAHARAANKVLLVAAIMRSGGGAITADNSKFAIKQVRFCR